MAEKDWDTLIYDALEVEGHPRPLVRNMDNQQLFQHIESAAYILGGRRGTLVTRSQYLKLEERLRMLADVAAYKASLLPPPPEVKYPTK